MSPPDDYCDLCDLPRSQCIHGMPPPPPVAARPPAVPASRSKPKPRVTTPKAEVRSKAKRWTPPEMLAPVIVGVLEDAGGQLEAEELFGELETQLEGRFLVGDQERTPEGELRWQYAARRARQALITDGVMTKGPGLWQLRR